MNSIKTVNKTTTEYATIAYVARYLQQIMNEMFEDAWMQICNIQRTQYFHLKTIASGNGAIIALRSLLQVENITAEIRGDVIYVWPCIEIREYELRDVVSCYENIPILFMLNNHTVNNAFLRANHLREITYIDEPQACKHVRSSYLKTSDNTFVEWNGKTLKPVELHVTDVSMALTFKQHESFHLNAADVYDEKNQILDHLIDLTELSSTVRAISKLLTMSAGQSEFDAESLAQIAHQLGNSTGSLLDSVFHAVGSLLPPTWVIYTIVGLSII
jgi:hypothetical protein